MINFTQELNSEQLNVVLHGDGPCLVLAGAGSGKTRTITYRVAYLLEQGVKPENILLVTFTNKAAAEMKRRVGELTALASALPWSGTFHHIGYRILRVYAPLLGYRNNFTVLDQDDSQSLLKLCIKEVRPETGGKRFPSAAVIQNIISYTRNAETPLRQVLEERSYQWIQFASEIERIAVEYEKRKKEANAMDFDDLLVNLLLLLGNDKVREKYSDQFHYILVDEYQDTNKIQASIIKKLASIHRNVLVVGDDAQSIYSFRAADIQNILQFPKEYPETKIFKLEINYRSTEKILELANNVIAGNREQFKKQLRAVGGGGARPELWPQLDQESEGNFVADKIEKMLEAGTPAPEIAVLFRASHHSQMLEVELVRRGIDYDYRGGVRFFERAHVKDVLAYLRILSNLADTAAWLRVLMHEEGIGPVAAQRLIDIVRELENVEQVRNAGEALGAKAQIGWNHFVAIWDTILNVPSRAPTALIDAIIGSGYREYLEGEYIDSRERLQDIKQLALFAEKYDSLEEFLADATLQESFRAIADDEPADGQRSQQQSSSAKIVLSTIHQAKGLEWEGVFIINLSNGSFPSERSLKESNGLEEERRLFYVAITRAKKQLYLTYPMAGGAYGDFLAGPSMFLNEIAVDLLDDHSLLTTDTTVLNDPSAGVEYIAEDDSDTRPKKIKPGSFLQDIADL